VRLPKEAGKVTEAGNVGQGDLGYAAAVYLLFDRFLGGLERVVELIGG
jgi:hypothetical protein